MVKKEDMKRSKGLLVLGILFVMSMMLVSAGNGQPEVIGNQDDNGLQDDKGNATGQQFMNLGEAQMNQMRNTFQHKFNFSEKGNWSYAEGENNSYNFQHKQEKKFLFWNVELNSEYSIDEDGEVLSQKKNFWARILGDSE